MTAAVRWAGVVDEDIEPAKLVECGTDESPTVGVHGDIGLDGNGAAAQRLDLRDGLLSLIAGAAVVDDDLAAPGGELLRGGSSHPRSTAGDDRDFSCYLHVLLLGNVLYLLRGAPDGGELGLRSVHRGSG